MDNETLISILDMPFLGRVAIVLLVLWVVYIIISRWIFKLVSLVSYLVSKVWYLVFLFFNNLAHVLHRAMGVKMIGIDQSVTDVFGGVYMFINRITRAVDGACYITGSDGNPTKTPKRPFVGVTFLVATVLAIWIVAPTWMHLETTKNMFTTPFHKYIEIESKVLDMVFREGAEESLLHPSKDWSDHKQ